MTLALSTRTDDNHWTTQMSRGEAIKVYPWLMAALCFECPSLRLWQATQDGVS